MAEIIAHIRSINTSHKKGQRKTPIGDAPIQVVAGSGLEGDAHAGDWHRQVSFWLGSPSTALGSMAWM